MCLRRHVSKLCTLREEERCSQLLPQKAAPYLRKGPVTSFVPSWLRLSTEQHGLAAPPLAEAKRLKSALRNVASVGLSVQQSTSSGREVTVHTRVFQFLRKLFLTSQVVQQLYLTARRGGSPFEFSRWKRLLNR
ncbi:UNVERIFIED_CONTAM: hypothetical protein Sradi_7242100 [Sesamum radiatum]|uniref:Uncharacterized protein n=1 Tax=Sesamum radiatum TaxID=300843 RepID=A0AAW2IMK2_SESRA